MKLQLAICCIVLASVAISQETSLSAGNSTSNSNGAISFSIGQCTYENESNSEENYSQGVQQPHEYFVLDISENDFNISVSVYPNPVQEILTIEFEESIFSQFDYQLVDLNGKTLIAKQPSDKITNIDMNNLASGSYILYLKGSNKQIKTYQITKN